MANRTPREDWGRLFNFAGGGLVHLELFEEFLTLMAGPTWLEIFAVYLLLRGTHSGRPAAADVPEGAEYYETDTGNRFKAVAGAWVADSSSGGGSAGPLTLVETIIVSTPTQDITFSGLDGDADGTYELIGTIINFASGNTSYTLQPNAETADMASVQSYNSAGTESGWQYSDLRLTVADSGRHSTFKTTLHPHTGTPRLLETLNTHPTGSSPSDLYGSTIWGQWTNTTDNITSLVLHSDNAAAFEVGTTVSLYKLAT